MLASRLSRSASASIKKLQGAKIGSAVFPTTLASRSRNGAAWRCMSIGVHDWPKDWIRRSEKWDDMDLETQGLWKRLGWDAQSWTDGRCPASRHKMWEDLRLEERQAAAELGYAPQLWDAEDKTVGKVDAAKKPKKRKNHYPAFDGPHWENPYTGYQ